MEQIKAYVVWHPQFQRGEQFALAIAKHFSGLGMARDGVALSIPVRARTQSWSGEPGAPPRSIDLSAAAQNIIVLLTDRLLLDAAQGSWAAYLATLEWDIARRGRRDLVLNVAFSDHAKRLPQFKGSQWCDRPRTENQLLIHLLAAIGQHLKVGRPAIYEAIENARPESEKESIFISYVRREAGEISSQIRQFVEKQHIRVSTFLDINDIPHGSKYKHVFERELRRSAMLALHTDSYGARPWCRWELLQAKNYRRPILVANLLRQGEERSFPYGANVPTRIYRFSDANQNRLGENEIERLMLDLMSEVIRCIVWDRESFLACQQAGLRHSIRLPRPPELADLFLLQRQHPVQMLGLTLVYPDPPVDDHERELLEAYLPSVSLRALGEIRSMRGRS